MRNVSSGMPLIEENPLPLVCAMSGLSGDQLKPQPFFQRGVFLSILALAAVLPAFAQPGNLQAMRTTAQQIVLSYNVSGSTPCRVEVSENSTYTPLVNDVNASLFPGSSHDLSRPGTFQNGNYRVIVIGARTVERGVNGKKLSRSLQTLTAHYIRLSECGGTATAAVVTGNIPFGPVTDAMPHDPLPGYEGYYGFASTNATDRNETIIDHLTGAFIRKVALPADPLDSLTNGTLGTPSGAGWTSPSGALTAADGQIAEYAGTAQAPLFVPNTQAYSNLTGIARLLVSMRAEILGGASGEDAKLQICLGTATACETDWKEITVTTCSISAVAGQCLDFGDPAVMSNFWWKKGEFPYEGWWRSGAGAGFRIRKKSVNPAHRLRIDSITYRAAKVGMTGVSSSAPDYCTDNVITDNGDGRKYVLCALHNRELQLPLLYSIDIEDGRAFYIGPAYMQAGVNGSLETTPVPRVLWDKTNPRVFYTNTVGTQAYVTRVYRCTISSTPGVVTTPWSGIRNQQIPNLTCVNMTATGYTVTEQVKALNPDFNDAWASRANSTTTYGWGLILMQNGKLIFAARQQQDFGAWVAVFDPHAPPPAGCTGCLGRIVAASQLGAASTPQPRKFCALHSLHSTTTGTDWLYFAIARTVTTPNNAAWGGPWSIIVKKPGCDASTQNCDVAPSDAVLEIVPQSGSIDWVDADPSPFLDDQFVPLEPGDLLMFAPGGIMQWGLGKEYIEITSVDRQNRLITVRRGTGILGSAWIAGSGFESEPYITNTAQLIPELTKLYGICRATAVNYNSLAALVWNFTADPLGRKYVTPPNRGEGSDYPPSDGVHPASSGYASPNMARYNNFGDHAWHSIDAFVHYTSNPAFCKFFYGPPLDICYVVQKGNDINLLNGPITFNVGLTPPFGGKFATRSIYETHPRRHQTVAFSSGRDLDHILDVQPFLVATTPQTSSLVAGTANVYKITGPPASRKHLGTMAFTGDRVLRDISGPGSLIDDTKPFTYCVALLAGECRAGSQAGDIYANSPLRNSASCSSFPPVAYPTQTFDICVVDRRPYTLGLQQTSIEGTDRPAIRSRIVSFFQARPHVQVIFSLGVALTNARWALFAGEDHGFSGFNLIKLPPMPEDQSKDPLHFERPVVQLKNAPSGTTNVVVEFGYGEDATPGQYYCTSRRDVCAVTAAVIDENNPFLYSSEVTSGLAYTNGISVQIPRLPGRVLYSRVKFRSNTNVVLETRVLPPL